MLILSRLNSTPVTAWLDMPLDTLWYWIKASNTVNVEIREAASGK